MSSLMPNILVTESQGLALAAALLAQLGPVVWGDLDRPALLAAVMPAEILWDPAASPHRCGSVGGSAALDHHCHANDGTQPYRPAGCQRVSASSRCAMKAFCVMCAPPPNIP